MDESDAHRLTDDRGPYGTLRRTDLAPLVDRYGELELSPADDLFERMVVSIINQLISTEAARTIRGRVFDRFEITPAGVATAPEEALREAGLSPQKIDYINRIAEEFEAGTLTREQLEELDDETAIDRLTEIKGIGDWTAKMTLMFGLGRPDVFPVEDLAVRRGMEAYFDDESRAAMRERAAGWRPYRSYGTLYVWKEYVRENSSVDEPVVE